MLASGFEAILPNPPAVFCGWDPVANPGGSGSLRWVAHTEAYLGWVFECECRHELVR
jgi:hypothetical protein